MMLGQVDGLAPRRRTDLAERHIDECDVVAFTIKLPGLMSRCEACIPQLADDAERAVDGSGRKVGVPDLR